MNVIKEIERINSRELEAGIYGGVNGSWHDKYKNSAWVYIGGLSYDLSEGDVICVMSQWGEIEDINLVRDKDTNKSKGFAFVKYENQKSTILAVDNFNGIKLLGRTLRCDHVDKYKLPKEVKEREEKILDEDIEATVDIGPGHAYKTKELENEFSIMNGQDVWQSQSSSNSTIKQVDSDSEAEDFSEIVKLKKRKHIIKDKVDVHRSNKHNKHHKHHKDSKDHNTIDDREDKSFKDINGHKQNGDKNDDQKSIKSGLKSVDMPPPRVPLAITPAVGGSSRPSANLVDPNAPVVSWRGNRDPVQAPAGQQGFPLQGRQFNSTSTNSSTFGKSFGSGSSGYVATSWTSSIKRGQFDGIGGIARLR